MREQRTTILDHTDWKEYGKQLLHSYFIVSTMISICISLLGLWFMPDARFGYEALLYPLALAGISMLPILLFRFLEPSLLKNVLELVSIELLMYLCVFGMEMHSASLMLGFGLGVALVYLAVVSIEHLLSAKEAKTMTSQLKAYQQRQQQS